jgi:hypothetical protein
MKDCPDETICGQNQQFVRLDRHTTGSYTNIQADIITDVGASNYVTRQRWDDVWIYNETIGFPVAVCPSTETAVSAPTRSAT